MKSVDFWKSLPLTAKLDLARQVVEKADSLSPSSIDAEVREIRQDMLDLVQRMLGDCIKELSDPERYP